MLINSNPDPTTHEITQLDITQNGLNLSMAIKLIIAGSVTNILNADLKNLFTIRFSQYDLSNNRMTEGYVEYSSSRASSISMAQASGGVVLSYSVPPTISSVIGNFGSMEVKVEIVPPVTDANYGWINFDLFHNYPMGITSNSTTSAWEEKVTFPVLTFAGTSLENFYTFPEYGKSLPQVPFGALYDRNISIANGDEYAKGFAIHAHDTYGYHKEFHFEPVGETRQFYFNALCPIHLQNNAYVNPGSGGFKMSRGDVLGFGGNNIVYRLHAFEMKAPCNGATIRWYDILNIYRRWLTIRKPAFYTKYKLRTTNGPVDSMSPHTIIANYGLDGAIDPSVIDPRFHDLNKWLELHPLKDGMPDMPGNQNLSLLKLLNQLKAKLVPAGTKLEAQIWGFEMAGFYRFYGGLPAASSAISYAITGNLNKFRDAMAELVANNIIPCVTTDPLAPFFNRGRFKGHMIKDSNDEWHAAIPHNFPNGFNQFTCAVSNVTINGVPFNRIWLVRGFIGLDPFPSCGDADAVYPFTKLNANGDSLYGPAYILGTGMYGTYLRQLCPTKVVEDIYLNKWLQAGLLDQGVRLIEFMKHPFDGRCYDKTHHHIEPVPPSTAAYTNAIGSGSWYAARCQSILKGLQDRGYNKDTSFSLTVEGVPTEFVIPYVDQFYTGELSVEVPFNFLYSKFITPKMTLFRDFAIHPGYKERRIGTQKPPPPKVLDAARDDEPKPTEATRSASFTQWLGYCQSYFNYFTVDSHGIAPKDYKITNATPPNETYTYSRCIQDVFNLRASIFEYGASAVVGRRLIVPAVYAEEPVDYNEELINMAARGVKLQMTFQDYFRRGYMLGEIDFISGNNELWTWGNAYITARPFDDVAVLLANIQADEAQFGPVKLPIFDLISRMADREIYYVKNGDPIKNEVVTYPRFPNMVWQLDGSSPKILYVIAHIGNKDNVPARFYYSRGLDTAPTRTWKKTITIISESGVRQITGTAQLGAIESSILFPRRSFVAIEFTV
ncbi:MAG TPA: hypothetical protein VGC66_01355 [Pyrinomonadaceae bacterium]|jgi:hypothetical protein